MNVGINIESSWHINNYLFYYECSSLYSLNESNNKDFVLTKDEFFLNNLFEQPKKNPENKKKYFKIIKQRKVGRKRKNYNGVIEKTHSKYDFDNIIRKIQVHFHNFLISFINEILINYGIKKKFLNTDYKNKKNVKKQHVDELKSKEIGEILCQNLSTKYRKQYKIDKYKNIKLYWEVIENESIKRILSEPYIYIFRNFYYKNKRDLSEYNLNVVLSSKVKTYKDFLKDCNKDSEYIEKIEKIVKKCYLPKKIFIQK